MGNRDRKPNTLFTSKIKKSFTSGNTEADDQIISIASLYCLQLEELLSVETGMWLNLQKCDKGSVPKIFGWSVYVTGEFPQS